MAVGSIGEEITSVRSTSSTSYTLPMVLMVSLYFSIGFITALNDILVPHFKDLFHLTNVARPPGPILFLRPRTSSCRFPSGLDRRPHRLQAQHDHRALHRCRAGLLLFVPASIVYLLSLSSSSRSSSSAADSLSCKSPSTPTSACARQHPIRGALAHQPSAASSTRSATTARPQGRRGFFIFIAAGATTARTRALCPNLPYVHRSRASLLLMALITCLHCPLPERASRTKSKEVDNQVPTAAPGAFSPPPLRCR